MAPRTLPTLPGCGRAASARIEAYAPAGGRLHGTLDASVYACREHTEQMMVTISVAGYAPYRMRIDQTTVKRCGDGLDLTSGALKLLAAPDPAELEVLTPAHPAWCDPALCTVTAAGRGSHATTVRVDEGTVVELEAGSIGRPTITISSWYLETDPDEPAGLIRPPDESMTFSIDTSAVLADTLTRLISASWEV